MSKNKFNIITSLVAFLFVFASFGQQLSGSKEKNIDKLMNKFDEYRQFNGSILVAHEGKVVYKKGFGMANFELDVPNTPTTKHRLASVTKQFTAMAILQLVDEGKLKLDVPISKYLPDYPKKNGDRITLHHLLTHTSGTLNYTNSSSYREKMIKPWKPTELVNLFADSALIFNPGSRIYYSNSGYVLLGVIIEKITGKTYSEVLQSNIFEPLGMVNSGYEKTGDILKNRSAGYYKQGTSLRNANFINMSVAYSAGGLYSTVEDLFLWDQALYTEKLISKELTEVYFDKHFPMYGGDYYAYGWEIGNIQVGDSDKKLETISHSGVINGYTSLITRIPSSNSSIIVINNVSRAPLNFMTQSIVGILNDKTFKMPIKSGADMLTELIDNDGFEDAIAYYEKNKSSKEIYFSETEMNLIGYDLLQAGKAKEAKTIFKAIMEAHPDSFNAYDSYAESLMVLGETEDAILYYHKSLDYNPENKNAIEMLKKLEK